MAFSRMVESGDSDDRTSARANKLAPNASEGYEGPTPMESPRRSFRVHRLSEVDELVCELARGVNNPSPFKI